MAHKSPLSRQEERVLSLARQGLGDKQIAADLGLSTDTVRTYWQRIRQKVGAGTRAEIISTIGDQKTATALEEFESEKNVLLHEILRRTVVEKALRTSEQQWRELADAMPQIVYVCRPDGTVFHVNARFQALTGMTLRDMRGRRWMNVFYPGDRPRLIKEIQASVGLGEQFDSQLRIRMLDGTFRWHVCRAIPIKEDGETTTRWYGTATDIHELVTMREELAARQGRVEQAQKLAKLGHFEYDISSKRSRWTQNLFEMFEMSPKEGWFDIDEFIALVEKVDSETRQQAVQRVIDTGEDLNAIYRVRTQSGRIVWIRSIAKKVISDSGAERLNGTIQDITDQQNATAEIERRETALAAAEKVAKIGSYDWDIENNVTIWSPNLAAIFEIKNSKQPLSESDFMSMLHEEDHEDYRQNIRKSINDGTPFDMEYRLVFGHRTKWIHALGIPTLRNQRTVRLVGTCQDISDSRMPKANLPSLASDRVDTFLASMLDKLPIGVFLTDQNGDCVYSNSPYQQVAGLTFQQLLGKGWIACIHPEDRESVFENWYRTAAIGEIYDQHLRYVGADGQSRNVHVRATAIQLSDGSLGYFGLVDEVSLDRTLFVRPQM